MTYLINGAVDHLRLMINNTRFLDDIIRAVGESELLERSYKKYLHGQQDKEHRRTRRYWRTQEDAQRMDRYALYRKIRTHSPDVKKHMTYDWLEGTDRDGEYRDYPIMSKVSFELTMLLLGKGVEIETRIPAFDRVLEQEFEIGKRMFRWMEEASVFGFIGLQSVITEDYIDVVRIQPDYIFPQRKPDCDDQFEYIAKRRMILPEQDEELWEEVMHRADANEYEHPPVATVFEERHFPGYIEYYLWVISQEDEIVGELPVHYYDPAYDTQVVFTGIEDFAITLIPCWEIGEDFLGDWDYMFRPLRSVNARNTHIGRILNKVDPKMIVGPENTTRDPRTGRVGMQNFEDFMVYHGDDTTKPEWLTASVDVAAHQEDLKTQIGMLGQVAHLAPQMIDPYAQIVDNASAYKMSLTPTMGVVAQRGSRQADQVARFIYNHLRLAYVYGVFNTKDFQDGESEPAERGVEFEETAADESLEDAAADPNKEDVPSITGSAGTQKGSLEYSDHELEHGIATQGLGEEEPTITLSKDRYTSFKIRNQAFQHMLSPEHVSVRFKPAIPQDDAALIERVGESTSVKRVLVEVDGMTECEAEAEWDQIKKEAEEGSVGDVNDTFGGVAGEFAAHLNPDQPALDENGQPIAPQDRVAEGKDVLEQPVLGGPVVPTE